MISIAAQTITKKVLCPLSQETAKIQTELLFTYYFLGPYRAPIETSKLLVHSPKCSIESRARCPIQAKM
jgi:hypothetical protein